MRIYHTSKNAILTVPRDLLNSQPPKVVVSVVSKPINLTQIDDNATSAQRMDLLAGVAKRITLLRPARSASVSAVVRPSAEEHHSKDALGRSIVCNAYTNCAMISHTSGHLFYAHDYFQRRRGARTWIFSRDDQAPRGSMVYFDEFAPSLHLC